MKYLFTLLTVLCLIVGGSQNAGAGNLTGRTAYGPFSMTAQNTCYPSDAGFEARTFDGDMSVFQWAVGGGVLAYTIQVSGYTTIEDPTNASFKSIANRDLTTAVDNIAGTVERFRFCTSTCTGNCTMKVKVIGRVPSN